ncbi:MAG: heme-binding domain-containing protein [Bacteroidota bacterium]
MKKKLLIIIGSLFLIIQLFPISKNQSKEYSKDISTIEKITPDVKNILEYSCSDCHSNNSNYPIYASIQPLAWWLQHHIDEGKEELNFSEFAGYSPRRRFHKLEEIKEQILENEMPLYSYTIVHTQAKLSEQQKSILINWVNSAMAKMKSDYHPDSLKMKRRK